VTAPVARPRAVDLELGPMSPPTRSRAGGDVEGVRAAYEVVQEFIAEEKVLTSVCVTVSAPDTAAPA
jgi:hypothetical protein